MARFRAPSVTPSAASSHAHRQRRLAAATLRPQQPSPRTGGAANTVPPNLSRREWCYLYVGNLHRSHTEAVLEKFFLRNRCGEVRRVIIRTTSGIPVVSRSAPISHLDRRYASVEFTDVFAIHRALALDGSYLRGARLKICLTPDELPEIKGLVQRHLQNKVQPDNRTFVTKAMQTVKRLTVQRTQPNLNAGPSGLPSAGPSNMPEPGPSRVRREANLSNRPPPEARVINRTQLMGVSFAKTIA